MKLDRESVITALKEIKTPSGDTDIVTAGVMRALSVEKGQVRFVLEVDHAEAESYAPVRAAAEAAMKALPGAQQVSVVLTAAAPAKPAPNLKAERRAVPSTPEKIPGVERVIAIASGKGGVGKSTVAANLACALAAEGRRTALLDADVYGPSQPRMLGVSGRPASPDGKTILPLHNHGVTMMSIGLMVEEGQAVIWRGPMLMGALQQMMMQVEWGGTDVLLVDLPPGTGDVQLTLAQRAVVDGALIVSTPQDVALIDARKAIDMFGKLGVPVLGMVENMSTHICTNCGHEEHIFGEGGVRAEAKALGVPLLAEIPLSLNIRQASDAGTPVVVSEANSPQAKVFRELAQTLISEGSA